MKIKFHTWYCGDEYCQCREIKITVDGRDTWDIYHSDPDSTDNQEVVEELREQVDGMVSDPGLDGATVEFNDIRELYFLEDFDWSAFDAKFK